MCGIMGIINKKGKAIKKVIEGLEKLEYRGYDAYPPYWKGFLKAVEPLFNKLKK